MKRIKLAASVILTGAIVIGMGAAVVAAWVILINAIITAPTWWGVSAAVVCALICVMAGWQAEGGADNRETKSGD
jgi:apolipoprotein N-acyltransferase